MNYEIEIVGNIFDNLESNSISRVDGKENKVGTYGYVCNIEFQNNGRYTKVFTQRF